MLSSIILILPYFGKFNNYFPFFLASCRNNPTVNWLIITDDKAKYNYPENVRVIYMTFEQFRALIQNYFEFKISLEKPYKLCDFKPAYGLILQNEIQGYDFWGYCDNDVIWGDIRRFLTEEILDGKEKVLSRGHLSIYRNNNRMINFFKSSTDGLYKIVFTNPKGFAFDEWGNNGIANYLKRVLNETEFWDGLPFDDFLTTSGNFKPAQKLDKGYINSIYYYDKGQLIRYYQTAATGSEILSESVLYTHFQKRPLEVETSNVDNFMIVPNKIIEPIEVNSYSIESLGRDKLINYQYLRIKVANIKRRLKL